MHSYIHIYTHIHIHIYTYAYIFLHTHTYTHMHIYISRIHVTCWLRQHFSFLEKIPKIVWFLGVASGSPRFPDPLSLPRPPLEPSPWRSARVLHKRFLTHTVKTQYFWARIFYIDIPFHYHFLSFNLYPIIINYRANALHNFCVA